MLIPTSSSQFCPRDAMSTIFKRSLTSDVTSTAEAFKSWDTCMDNKVCKIVAIVGIVLAVLFVFWIVSSIINCIYCGANCVRALCCCFCCCNNGPRRGYRDREVAPDPEKNAYNNPNMYPPTAQNYSYQAPMAMQPSYAAKNDNVNTYGYVRDVDDDGIPSSSSPSYTQGNSAAEYYSNNAANKHNSTYRGQNTYF